MTQIAYPFVVARNRTLDWRALVAPDELIATNEDFGLVLQTGDEHPAPVTVRRWQDHSARTWVLCYRSVPAEREFVGENRPGQLTDKFGRDLYLVEGVVLPGSREPSTTRAHELVEQIHDDAVSAFREFWSEVDEAIPPIASAPISTAPLPSAARDVDGCAATHRTGDDRSAEHHVVNDRVADEVLVSWWQSLLRGRRLVIAGGILAVVLALAWVSARALGVVGTCG